MKAHFSIGLIERNAIVMTGSVITMVALTGLPPVVRAKPRILQTKR